MPGRRSVGLSVRDATADHAPITRLPVFLEPGGGFGYSSQSYAAATNEASRPGCDGA